MKTHWLWGTFILIAAMLACSNPFQKEPSYTATTIKSVSVIPPSGTKDFMMEVTYETFWIPEKRIPNILCYYVTPKGITVQIGVIDMFSHIGSRQVDTATKTLAFSVAADNLTIQPGTYLAGCTTETNSAPVTTTFIVIATVTPTPELPSEPAAMPTATLQTAPLKGKIIFDYNSYQSSRPSGAGELSVPTSNCIPEVTITADGVISGNCEYNGPTSIRTQSTITVHVTGIAVQGGSFTFTYDVTERFPNGWGDVQGSPADVNVWSFEQVRHIFYTGTGVFTSATQASGVATFDFSCDTGADNLIHCWKWSKESFSGTISWSFIPSP